MANLLRYAEVCEETVFAQDPPPPAGSGVYIDIASTSLDVAGETDGIVESAFGRSARKKYAGWYSPEGDLSYQVNIRTIINFVKWTLGGYAFTAGAAGDPAAVPPTNAAPNVHEAWGSDDRTIPSFTARIGKDLFEHLFVGCTVNSLELEVEDELVSLTVELATRVDSRQPLQSKRAVFTALPSEKEIPFHQVNVSIAGVLQRRKMKNLTLSISNNADAESGRYLGERYAGRIPVNERETTCSTEMDYADLQQIERLWGGPDGPSEGGATEFPVSLDYFGGLNANGEEQRLVVELPRVFYTTVETQPSGREETMQPVEIRALTDSVTLADGITTVETDIYARCENYAPVVAPVA